MLVAPTGVWWFPAIEVTSATTGGWRAFLD
jgi:hypothetical protein